jgi:hypothetical protein
MVERTAAARASNRHRNGIGPIGDEAIDCPSPQGKPGRRLLVGVTLLLSLTTATVGGLAAEGHGGRDGAHDAADLSASYSPELQRRLEAALAELSPHSPRPPMPWASRAT